MLYRCLALVMVCATAGSASADEGHVPDGLTVGVGAGVGTAGTRVEIPILFSPYIKVQPTFGVLGPVGDLGASIEFTLDNPDYKAVRVTGGARGKVAIDEVIRVAAGGLLAGEYFFTSGFSIAAEAHGLVFFPSRATADIPAEPTQFGTEAYLSARFYFL